MSENTEKELLIAIAQIDYINLDGQRATAEPGVPFEIDSERAAGLKDGAAREPNDAERALFEKQAEGAAKRAPRKTSAKTQTKKTERKSDDI